MPVRDRRSSRPRALSQSANRDFRPATRGGVGVAPSGIGRWCGPDVGMGRRHWRWFRAPARCRSETGAPAPRSFTIPDVGMGRRHRRWFRAPARCRSETGAPAPRSFTIPDVGMGRRHWRWFRASGVIGDAGRRPALQPSPRSFTIGRGSPDVAGELVAVKLDRLAPGGPDRQAQVALPPAQANLLLKAV